MNLDAFHSLVMPEVIGCPAPVLNTRLLVVAAEFCRETQSWFGSHTIPLIDGVSDYALTTPTDSRIETVISVSVNGWLLTPTADDISHLAAISSEPGYYNALSVYGQISVYPTPINPTSSLLVKAAYAPTGTATTLPDYLERFADVIASGVKGNLMTMPNTDWSNPQLGAFYLQKFSEGIANCRISDAHGRVRGSLRVAPRPFI